MLKFSRSTVFNPPELRQQHSQIVGQLVNIFCQPTTAVPSYSFNPVTKNIERLL